MRSHFMGIWVWRSRLWELWGLRSGFGCVGEVRYALGIKLRLSGLVFLGCAVLRSAICPWH
ncbi:MAG: hypothetical protein HC903_32290 [Methylacidiphilales bacterium]|nr:hypothetical protein [Candidatus Methylacidiphilales bacterium]